MSSSFTCPVVTGSGAVTPFGTGVAAFWDGLVSGGTTVAPIRGFPAADLHPAHAAEVRTVEAGPDRAGDFLLAAAHEAIASAGIDIAGVDPARVGVAVGTTLGGMRVFEGWLAGVADGDPACIPFSAPAMRLAAAIGAGGPVVTTQLACASGTAAVALGARWVREGRCDVVLAGGTDLLCRYVVAGFNCLRATAPEARPFDAARRGLVLGEGAGALVLESAVLAARRGGRARAVLTGAAAAADAVHMTAPDRDGRGAARAIGEALRRAGLAPDAVRFVSAHGTGTPYNDAMEARAIVTVFGERTVPVNSVKGAIGHTLGAAGTLEAVLSVEILARSVIPPTAGLQTVAPECAGLDLVVGAARPADVRACVSTSSGFAGANAAIVLERP